MAWVVTLHSGTGSMTEGATPKVAFTRDTREAARTLNDDLNKAIGRHADSTVRQECWAQMFEVGEFPDESPEEIVNRVFKDLTGDYDE